MKLGKIEKWSFGYMLIRAFAGHWHNRVFYRKIVILNRDRVPLDSPVIFAANHQNSLMDALAVIYAQPSKQLVYLARSDIFKKGFVSRLLFFIKMLPIYRIRDGYSALKNNDAVFLKTIDVIKNKRGGLALLPEGSHEGIHRLRELKKGFARIAFQTEEANNYELDIKIVPVGLDYDDYVNYRSRLTVNFGHPLSVSEYYDRYKENNVKGINALKQGLWEAMHPNMIHIESEEYYDCYNNLRKIYRSRMMDQTDSNSGVADQADNSSGHKDCEMLTDMAFVNKLTKYEKEDGKEMPRLAKMVTDYTKERKALNIRQSLIEADRLCVWKTAGIILALIIGFPAFLYGLVNNFLPYWIPIRVSRIIKDPQFLSSFRYALSLLLFPIIHIPMAVVFGLITGSWLWAGIFYLSFIPTALFAWWWKEKWNYLGERFRWKKSSGLREKHRTIVALTDSVLGNN